MITDHAHLLRAYRCDQGIEEYVVHYLLDRGDNKPTQKNAILSSMVQNHVIMDHIQNFNRHWI